jgi:hypothetical protein
MAVVPNPSLPADQPELRQQGGLPIAVKGYNTPFRIAMTRQIIFDGLDGATRIAAQMEKDAGEYVRPPVLPVEYSEGNIKKSTQPIGVAGYNHKGALAIPTSPDDMSQREYLISMAQSLPDQRERMRLATLMNPKQTFLQKVQLDNLGEVGHNMPTPTGTRMAFVPQ